MTYKLFRWVGAVWTVVLFMAVAASELHAIDSKGRSFAYGVGQKTCEDYVKFREKRLETLEKHERYTKDELYEIVDKIVEHWIAGFLTAHNFYVADTYDVAGKSGMDDLESAAGEELSEQPETTFRRGHDHADAGAAIPNG